MSTQVVIVLFAVNSVLVLTVLAILLSVLRQGKHIADLAKETQSLAEHAEEHVGADTHLDGEEQDPEVGIDSRE